LFAGRLAVWATCGTHPSVASSGLRLTLRSSGAPTACRQALAGGTQYIFASQGLASYRWCPLSSTLGCTNARCLHPLIFSDADGSPSTQLMGLPRLKPKTTPFRSGQAQTIHDAGQDPSRRVRSQPVSAAPVGANAKSLASMRWCARSWQAWSRIQKIQIQRFAFKSHGRVQLCAGACVGQAPMYSLTLRSRGRPNGMAHWPSSAGACGPILRLLSSVPCRRSPP
jgi:hypothetical protein